MTTYAAALSRLCGHYMHAYICNVDVYAHVISFRKSGHLVCDLGRLELTVVTGQFSILYRQVFMKVINLMREILNQVNSVPVPV